jgi:hypothetical protein
MTSRLVLLVSIAIPIAALAQGPRNVDQLQREAAARVNALSDRLRYRADDPADQRRYYSEVEDLTARLQREVDRYIQGAVSAGDDSERVQARLRSLLAAHKPYPESGDLAFARTGNLRSGPALLVAYTIVRPPHLDSATIRGYRTAPDGLELVATEGSDFDGYGMFKKQLPSPVPGEIWLFAWGRAHTFNGTRIRFRLYAFDGEHFRTLWSPDDMFNATVSFGDSGFAIDHYVPKAPFDLHDEYVLSPDGPVKTVSR